MRLVYTIILSIIGISSFAQYKKEEGFDARFKPSSGVARYYVVTVDSGNGRYYREAYYLPEKTLAMKGWYVDVETKKADGRMLWFYTNGNLKSDIQYANGKINGQALYYHDNGMMSDSATYINGIRTGVSLGWNKDGDRVDSTNFDGKGNGTMVRYYSDGQVMSAGFIKQDTMKIKRWNYYHSNGQLLATEDYDDKGEVKKCDCFTTEGVKLDSKQCEMREAKYVNDVAWSNFVARTLNADVPVKKKAPLGDYMVLVEFVVSKDGKIEDIRPLTSFGYGMEQEVERMLKKSPRWTPALQFGRPVRAYRLQPITFSVTQD